MNFFSVLGMEFRKIHRSKILFLLFLPLVILWIPNVINAHMNFQTTMEGISPENNFFVQSFMGFTWFMMPASLIVCNVLLIQTERSNRGIVKMLSMPIHTVKLCMAKLLVLVILAALQMLMMTGMYFICAKIASHMQDYSFALSPVFVLEQAGILFVASIPMISFFWMMSVYIQTPIFSIGIGLAMIVPSVLIINTKVWFLYPMCYPFYVIVLKYNELAAGIGTGELKLVPWVLAAVGMTIIFSAAACGHFGKEERR